MKIELDSRFKKKAKGIFEKYEFEVGILTDKPHKKPLPKSSGLKVLYGGPARQISSKPSGLSVAQVSNFNRRKKDYLRRPFKKRSSDIIKFSNHFFKVCFGKGMTNRLVNYLQAIVRNPILRGDYGPNKPSTVRNKGFNRYMIDTGQLFNSIKAKVIKRV